MTKYYVLRLWGLKDLLNANSDLYSPEGNKLIAVNNGILGGQVFYDAKSEKVYGLCLKEIPVTEVDLERIDGEYAQSQIPYYMSYKDAIEFLKSKGKWNK